MTTKYICTKPLYTMDMAVSGYKHLEIVSKDEVYNIRLNFMSSAKDIKEYDILDANEDLIYIIDQKTLDLCFLAMAQWRELQIKSVLDD